MARQRPRLVDDRVRLEPADRRAHAGTIAATGSPLARMKSVVDGLMTRSNGKYKSARGSSASDARRMFPTMPTISALHVAKIDAVADRLSPAKKRSATASLMITTAGPVASRGSKRRPARSGMCSARK